MIWQNHSVAFSVFGLDVRWYGIAYLIGFFLTLYLGKYLFDQLADAKISRKKWEDFIFGIFFAGVIGGRLGEFLFYSPTVFWQNPLEIFQIWHGGMSIHGGVLGALFYAIYWSIQNKISLLKLLDAVVLPLSISLGLGRITNYLNGELAGQPTNSDWGVVFPHVDNLLRHPTQLYESAGSFLLAVILYFVFTKYRKLRGILTATFLFGYGFFRFLIEFWKSPDGWEFLTLSTGQWLCLVMIFASFFLFFSVNKKNG